MQWFAVQTHGAQEERANRALGAKGYVTFYPQERVRRNRRSGHRVITEWTVRAYYPRYLFTRVHIGDIGAVNATNGVCSVLCPGGAPLALPDGAMRVLMAGADKKGIMGSRDEVARKRFAVAQSVQFLPGSTFEGFVAQIIKDDGRRDVQVLVSMFGRVSRVTVPATALCNIAA